MVTGDRVWDGRRGVVMMTRTRTRRRPQLEPQMETQKGAFAHLHQAWLSYVVSLGNRRWGAGAGTARSTVCARGVSQSGRGCGEKAKLYMIVVSVQCRWHQASSCFAWRTSGGRHPM